MTGRRRSWDPPASKPLTPAWCRADGVDTGTYVQPPGGNPSVAAPLFEVVRTDLVRIFVDVPEADSALVLDGGPARVQVQALGDRISRAHDPVELAPGRPDAHPADRDRFAQPRRHPPAGHVCHRPHPGIARNH